MKRITLLSMAILTLALLTSESQAQIGRFNDVLRGSTRTNEILGKIRLQNGPQLAPGGIVVPTPTQTPNFRLPSPGVMDAIRSSGVRMPIPRLPATPGVIVPPADADGIVRFPPGTLPPGILRPVDPPPALSPSPTPAPPRRRGPTIQFGNGGPSVSFGNGPVIQVPLPNGRFRNPQPGQVFHQPPQILGYGPNGEVYTQNSGVANSAFTPGRNLSQLNGSKRTVQRPVYDQFGNIVGYQQGEVWNNSLTGQEHGSMTTVTPNGTGGTLQSNVQYSTAGGNIQPMMNGN